MLADVPAGDVVRETRRQLAGELVDELEVIDARIKTAKKQLAILVAETGSGLMGLNGIGPSGAARLLGDIGDVSRFPTKAHFASWNGTPPLDASSGDQDSGTRRTGSEGHLGATTKSSAAGSNPNAGASDKSLSEPASIDATPTPDASPGRTPGRSRRR